METVQERRMKENEENNILPDDAVFVELLSFRCWYIPVTFFGNSLTIVNSAWLGDTWTSNLSSPSFEFFLLIVNDRCLGTTGWLRTGCWWWTWNWWPWPWTVWLVWRHDLTTSWTVGHRFLILGTVEVEFWTRRHKFWKFCDVDNPNEEWIQTKSESGVRKRKDFYWIGVQINWIRGIKLGLKKLELNTIKNYDFLLGPKFVPLIKIRLGYWMIFFSLFSSSYDSSLSSSYDSSLLLLTIFLFFFSWFLAPIRVILVCSNFFFCLLFWHEKKDWKKRNSWWERKNEEELIVSQNQVIVVDGDLIIIKILPLVHILVAFTLFERRRKKEEERKKERKWEKKFKETVRYTINWKGQTKKWNKSLPKDEKKKERKSQVRGKKKEKEKENSREKKGRQRERRNVMKMVSCHLMMMILSDVNFFSRKKEREGWEKEKKLETDRRKRRRRWSKRWKNEKEEERRDVDYCAIEVYWCEDDGGRKNQTKGGGNQEWKRGRGRENDEKKREKERKRRRKSECVFLEPFPPTTSKIWFLNKRLHHWTFFSSPSLCFPPHSLIVFFLSISDSLSTKIVFPTAAEQQPM